MGLRLTQGRHPVGAYSHMHQQAMDFSYGANPAVYAPYNCIIRYTQSNLGIVCLESVNPVSSPEGVIDYQWMTLLHGNVGTAEGYRQRGEVIKKRTPFYAEGVNGTDSAHIHLECGYGHHPNPTGLSLNTAAQHHYLNVTGYPLSASKISSTGAHPIEDCLFIPDDVYVMNIMDRGASFQAVYQDSNGAVQKCPDPFPTDWVIYLFKRANGRLVHQNEGFGSDLSGSDERDRLEKQVIQLKIQKDRTEETLGAARAERDREHSRHEQIRALEQAEYKRLKALEGPADELAGKAGAALDGVERFMTERFGL